MDNSETNKGNEDLRAIYSQLCSSYHSVDDFRAKLLGFLPLASGAAIIGLLYFKKDSFIVAPYITEIGIFFTIITIGLLIYELKGIQKCVGYILAGSNIERRLLGEFHANGMFEILNNPKLNISGFFTEPVASAIIYSSVICAWVYITIMNVVANKLFVWAIVLFVFILVFILAVKYWIVILSKMKTKILKADHILLKVSNFEETCKWYKEKLGAVEKKRWENDGLNFAYYDINGFSVEIVGDGQPEKQNKVSDHLNYEGYRHLCFKVNDIHAVYKELKDKGVIFLNEPEIFPPLNRYLVHFKDNNGNVIELMSE